MMNEESPENLIREEFRSRIQHLQDEVTRTENEIRCLHTHIKNRDPEAISRLKAENSELTKRTVQLQRALHALLNDFIQPKKASDLHQHMEILRWATVDFCRRSKISRELWQSLEY